MNEPRPTILHPGIRILTEGRDDIGGSLETESRRSDADDRIRFAAIDQRTADGGFVAAEPALPQAVADHRDRRRALLVFVGTERAAAIWCYAQDVEQVGCYQAALDVLGGASSTAPADGTAAVRPFGGRERVDCAGDVPVVGIRESPDFAETGWLRVRDQEPARIGIGQRSQQ